MDFNPSKKIEKGDEFNLLIKGAKVRDLIGVSYSTIRGCYDLASVTNRKTSRSLYGVKKFK